MSRENEGLLGFLDPIFEQLEDRWVLAASLYLIPTAVILIIDVAGGNLGAYDTQGNLKPLALIIFILALVIEVSYAFGRERFKTVRNKELENTTLWQSKVANNLISIAMGRLNEAQGVLEDYSATNTYNPALNTLHDPFTHITTIATGIHTIFADILDITPQDLSVVICYRFTGEDKNWKIPVNINEEKDMIRLMLAKEGSVFSDVYRRKDGYLRFIVDKYKAVQDGEYIHSATDVNRDLIGSILVKDISMLNQEQGIEAMISISSYGSRMTTSAKEKSSREKLDKIISRYIRHIKFELLTILCLEYGD